MSQDTEVPKVKGTLARVLPSWWMAHHPNLTSRIFEKLRSGVQRIFNNVSAAGCEGRPADFARAIQNSSGRGVSSDSVLRQLFEDLLHILPGPDGPMSEHVVSTVERIVPDGEFAQRQGRLGALIEAQHNQVPHLESPLSGSELERPGRELHRLGAGGIVLNAVIAKAGAASEEAMARGLETTSCTPSVPCCAENCAAYSRWNKLLNLL